MRRFFLASIGGCLLANAAVAFEQSGASGGAKTAVPASPAAPMAGVGNTLSLESGELATKPSTGGDVRIPGLGALGVLPKLDFGLELLYGEGRAEAIRPRDDDAAVDNDGLQIKGTLKHRF